MFLDEMIYGLTFQTVSFGLGSLTQYHMLFEILDLSFQIFVWVLLRLSYIDLHQKLITPYEFLFALNVIFFSWIFRQKIVCNRRGQQSTTHKVSPTIFANILFFALLIKGANTGILFFSMNIFSSFLIQEYRRTETKPMKISCGCIEHFAKKMFI